MDTVRPVATEARWWRGPARLEDGWLVLDAERAEAYHPIEERDLLYDVAAIGTPREAVEAVERYGLLWTRADGDDPRERFADWERELNKVRGALNIHRLLYEARQGSREAVTELGQYRETIATALGAERESEGGDELRAAASQLLALAVSSGLEGVEERVVADVTLDLGDGQAGAPGRFRLSAQPPHLLGFVYHALAMAVVGSHPARRCGECGRVFPLGDKRQQYCTNLCAGRARYHRWAKRKQEADDGG